MSERGEAIHDAALRFVLGVMHLAHKLPAVVLRKAIEQFLRARFGANVCRARNFHYAVRFGGRTRAIHAEIAMPAVQFFLNDNLMLSAK